MDCGDVSRLNIVLNLLITFEQVPAIPFDTRYAVDQIDTAYSTLIDRPVANRTNFGAEITKNAAKDRKPHPRVVTLGGDHSIVLPILRALHSVYGEIAVIHFDSHLDTWPIQGFYGVTENTTITHGTMFWTAMKEGLIAKGRSIHAGIRCMMTVSYINSNVFPPSIDIPSITQGYRDIQHDEQVGFSVITTDDIEELGTEGIVRIIKRRVGDKPVYLR